MIYIIIIIVLKLIIIILLLLLPEARFPIALIDSADEHVYLQGQQRLAYPSHTRDCGILVFNSIQLVFNSIVLPALYNEIQ